MTEKIKYEFTAKVWMYNSTGAWHFVSLPPDLSKEIRESLKWQEEGWGRLKVSASIGNTQWETAIWYDTKLKCYLLPLKSEIRKKEKIENDEMISVSIFI